MKAKTEIEIAKAAMLEILEKSKSEKNRLRAVELLVELKKFEEADQWKVPG